MKKLNENLAEVDKGLEEAQKNLSNMNEFIENLAIIERIKRTMYLLFYRISDDYKNIETKKESLKSDSFSLVAEARLELTTFGL